MLTAFLDHGDQHMAGRTGLSPYLCASNASDAIAFYCKAFGAEERYRLVDPRDGRIGHAELGLGGETLMIADEYPEMGATSPQTLGGTAVKLHLYVDDVDAVFAHALELGAKEVRAPQDQFFGERSGALTDPFGHEWFISTHQRDVSAEEMQAAWAAMFSS